MTKNISITVNEENLKYLDSQINNRSKYINELIEQDRRSKFAARMRAGYIAQSQNQEIQEEDRGGGVENNFYRLRFFREEGLWWFLQFL